MNNVMESKAKTTETNTGILSAAQNDKRSAAQLEMIALDDIRLSGTNPRKSFDDDAMGGLVASIAATGVTVPLIVRYVTDPVSGADGAGLFELVSGERRLRAAQELGLERVPCIVRQMTDAEARETQIVENLQRADVHPMEEAEAFDELRNRLGSIPAVAARLGKEQSYVAKCLRLLTLTLLSRDALRNGVITIEHALLLARLAEIEQNEALKWTLDRNAGSKKPIEKVVSERIELLQKDAEGKKGSFYGWTWEPESVVKLKAHIETEGGVKLSRAPWSLEEDVLLPDVPACSRCEKNTNANSPLFGDLDMGDPTCTDGACFQAKTAALVRIACGISAVAKLTTPRLSWKSSTVRPAIAPNDMATRADDISSTANPAKILREGQWVEAKKGSCPNVRPGVTVDWSDSGQRGYMGGEKKLRKPGETLLVCIALGCKVHVKDYEKPKSSNDDGYHSKLVDLVEEKRKEEAAVLIAKVEPQIREKIFGAIVAKLDTARAVHMAADSMHGAPEFRKLILRLLPDANGERLEALAVFGCQFSRALSVNSYWMAQDGGTAKDRADLWKLAQAAGVDANAIAAKHFHDQGSIAPACAKLYPKGVPWPKGTGPANTVVVKKVVAKKIVKKSAAKADRGVPGDLVKKPKTKAGATKKLSEASRKRIVDAMKKHWAARRKAVTK
jgi:ParB/RepB/Spo0J family partition protein